MTAPSTQAPPGTTDRGFPSRWHGFAVAGMLAALVAIVFGQTLGFPFVNLDDNENIYENPVVSKGLSAANIGWAFTHTQVSRWVPLSTLAHMLDAELYGLQAGGHHLTCVLLHLTATILLFVVLRGATGALWRSAFVAALFAIHPLHVEAVAWVSALQYALSGALFMLTLWAYFRYTRQPSVARYFLVAALFVLGLLAKEMLLTLPALLLVLDYWPLNRWPASGANSGARPPTTAWGLFREKLPLFLFSVVSAVVTLVALRSFRQDVVTYSWPVRIGNAFVSYAAYVGQMLFPQGLTPWYPHPGSGLVLAEVVLSALVVIGISVGAFMLRRTRPYLLAGWLWYLGLLVPVIGLVQRGEQARCDRYTYLSQIGLYIMIAWGVADLSARWRHRRAILGFAGAAVVVILAACAWVQTSHWRSSEALWRHTLAHTTRNYVAHINLAVGLAENGRLPEALPHFKLAVDLRPTSPEAQNNYGYALASSGRVAEAVPFYQNAIRLKGDFVNAHLNLADALVALGRANEARAHYDAASRLMGRPVQPAR